MNALIWKYGKIRVWLTTESACSRYGIPVVRIEHPAQQPTDPVDFGPADIAPHDEDEQPGTVAQLVCLVHQRKPFKGEVLEGAKRFLAQWPDGPQIL